MAAKKKSTKAKGNKLKDLDAGAGAKVKGGAKAKKSAGRVIIDDTSAGLRRLR
jgi:hypothetical protein